MYGFGVLIDKHRVYLLVMFKDVDELHPVLSAGTADQIIPPLSGVLSLVVLSQQQLLLAFNPQESPVLAEDPNDVLSLYGTRENTNYVCFPV